MVHSYKYKMKLNFICLNIFLFTGYFNMSPEYIKTVIASCLAIAAGLVVKIGLDWDNNTLTWKRAFINSMFSSGVGYVAFFWLEGRSFLGVKYQIWLALISFCAAHIVTGLDTIGKERLGSGSLLETFLDRFLAKKKEERSSNPKNKENDKS